MMSYVPHWRRPVSAVKRRGPPLSSHAYRSTSRPCAAVVSVHCCRTLRRPTATRAIIQRNAMPRSIQMKITRREFGATLAATALVVVTPVRYVFAQNAEIKLKYGTAFPADHPGSVRIKEAAEAIRKDTGGRVDLQVYPASQLGS